jgi:hypothetical protein
MTPFYEYYPKDPVENIRWRIRCRERAIKDERFRQVFWQAGMDDPLFFCAAFLWVYEPRSRVKVKPFIPWSHQEPIILAMDAAIDEAMETEQPLSLTVKKSRAQGGTYIYLAVQIRRALKEAGFSTGLVTRNEDLVDSRTDSSAVMYKLAWMLDRLPYWMLEGYQRSLSEHTIALPNESLWVGYAATGDVARGGRMTIFAFDEPGSEEFIAGNKDYKVMSSVSHVSNCTFLVSTFGVDAGVFYESATDPDNPRVYTLDWKDNVDHSRNAYVYRDGTAEAVRPEEEKAVKEYISSHSRELRSIERRGHKMEGKFRSPWYDAHCLLPGGTTRFIARELDMDPRGAVGKVFSSELLDRMKLERCKLPVWQGTPVFDPETLSLIGLLSREDGPLKLWFQPGPDFSCPRGNIVGCDLAVGSDGAYSSNSVASGIAENSGDQIMEYTIKGMPLIKFARNVVGLCKWLHEAFLGWEDSGMAAPFAKEVLEVLYYGNVYYREVEAIGDRRATRKPGWWNGKDEHKADLFEKLALAMEIGGGRPNLEGYTPRSEDLVRECGEYEWEKGKIIHQPTKNRGATEKAHGDRVIAAGVAWLMYQRKMEGVSLDMGDEKRETAEYGSFLWREQQERPRNPADSPKFGLIDVVRR